MATTVFIAMKEVSQRCPGKNILLMNDQLKLLHEINNCLDLNLVICTDCPTLQETCQLHSFVWIDRPRYTTWQGGGSFKVQLYAVDNLELEDDDIFIDFNICHLGATLELFTKIISKCRLKNTTVITLERSTVPPQKQFFIRDGEPVPVMGIEMSQFQMTSQLLEPAYIPSGINAIPVRQMKQYGTIYNSEASYMIVDPTTDIDYPEDLTNVSS
jgi:CMP-N-acetylneuraminic acid synthetase